MTTINKSAVTLENLSKKFTLHHEKPTLVENIFSQKIKEEVWALKNINLVVNSGEKLGIIGSNGSGKSTLLKIMAGITAPTSGKIKINGKVVTLIDLDAGFHPELTGEENIYLSGMLLGMNRRVIQSRLKQIIEFSGLKKVIDTQLFTYSSGMRLRLGFSVALFSDPDIFLIDEVLGMGDREFQKKSFQKLTDLFHQKKTIIFISHQLESIRQNCSRVVWLNKGKIEMDGSCQKVIPAYIAFSSKIHG